MADAADSKSAVRKGVWVRIPPWAQVFRGTSIQASLYTHGVGSWLVERRLAQTSVRLRESREKIRVADEQLDAMADEASHHELRALVSETPDASYEYRQAKAHADAMRKHRDDLVALVKELEQRQDDLLDKMSGSRRREGDN